MEYIYGKNKIYGKIKLCGKYIILDIDYYNKLSKK